MKKATPNRFLNAGRPGVLKVKMSLGRAMKTTDLNRGLNGGFGTLGPASEGGKEAQRRSGAKITGTKITAAKITGAKTTQCNFTNAICDDAKG